MNANATKAQTAAATKTACECGKWTVVSTTGEVARTGCTEVTTREFAPGHDAKMKSLLIFAGANDHLVTRNGEGANVTPVVAANRHGFGHMVTAGIRRAKMLAEAKAERAAKREAMKALRATATHTRKAKKVADRKVTAKVGRWLREGTVSEGEFTYTDKKGAIITTTKYTLAS